MSPKLVRQSTERLLTIRQFSLMVRRLLSIAVGIAGYSLEGIGEVRNTAQAASTTRDDIQFGCCQFSPSVACFPRHLVSLHAW
jgi:hypothetical protein